MNTESDKDSVFSRNSNTLYNEEKERPRRRQSVEPTRRRDSAGRRC